MRRIVYASFPKRISGGQKTSFRHVELLTELGFNAVFRVHEDAQLQPWMEAAPFVERGTPLTADDIIVAPDDAPSLLTSLARARGRGIVFVQNHLSSSLLRLDPGDRRRLNEFMTGSETIARWILRRFPGASVAMIPFFADERVFTPAPERRLAIITSPKKRRQEEQIIRELFHDAHPEHRDLPWISLMDATEREVADAFRTSAVFLSLSRLEGLGLTPLEAMASGCLVAGFKGIGGREYATDSNGFWVEDDDCEAAAEALARAVALAKLGGPALGARKAAGAETAACWSYARFRNALDRYWSFAAPQAKRLV